MIAYKHRAPAKEKDSGWCCVRKVSYGFLTGKIPYFRNKTIRYFKDLSPGAPELKLFCHPDLHMKRSITVC